MNAQASMRKTQKIRLPPEIDVIGAPTMQFFREGDALEEATRQANVESEARRRAAAFADSSENDKAEILTMRDGRPEPKATGKRGAAITLAVLSSFTAIGVAAWMWMTPPAGPAREWLKATAAPLTDKTGPMVDRMKTMVAAAATAVEGATTTTADTEGGATTAAPADLALAASEQAPRATGPVIELIPPVRTERAVAQNQAKNDGDDSQAAARPARARNAKHGNAMRGYVWSPTAQAMVTNTSATAPTRTTTRAATPATVTGDATPARATSDTRLANPDAVMPPTPATSTSTTSAAPVPATTRALPTGPGIAPPNTGPAPDETARVPTTEPAPFEAAPSARPSPAPAAKSAAPIPAPIID